MLRGMKKVHREELPVNVQNCYKLSRGPVTNDQCVNDERKGNLDSSLSLSAMYSELDQLLRDRSSPWSTKLVIPHITTAVENGNSDLLSEITSDPSCIDLASHGRYNIIPCMNKKYRHIDPLFYFDKARYPVTGGFLSPQWKELRNMIMLSSLQCGFKLFCNGKYKIRHYTDNQMFCCVRRRMYRSSVKKKVSGYQNTSFHNDRQNSRGSKG